PPPPSRTRRSRLSPRRHSWSRTRMVPPTERLPRQGSGNPVPLEVFRSRRDNYQAGGCGPGPPCRDLSGGPLAQLGESQGEAWVEGVKAMAETGYASFNRTVDKTNRVLREIEEAHGWSSERRNQSYAALRAVLHALRDRLTVEESAQFAAQLPMLIRGIYYDGWRPSTVPVKADRKEFLERVASELAFEVQES